MNKRKIFFSLMFIFLIFIFSTITFSQVPTVTTIDSVGDVGKYLSMKIDSSGKIWLSYYDATRQIIKIAHKENNNWMINEINQAKSSGNYTSMVIDPLNKISITFSDPVYNEVKYIGWLPIAPLANLSVIDSINNPGYYSLLTKDTLGNLAMTYVAEATKQIRYAFKSGLSWSTQNLFQSSSMPSWSSLVYDKQNRPNVTFTDPVNSEVKYMGWLTAVQNINISVIDSINNPGYYSLLTKDTLGNLAMTYVAEATKQIRYAFKSGLSWSTQNLFQSSSTLGWPSLVYDRQNRPNVTVTDPVSNDVKYIGWLSIPSVANISVIDSVNNPGYYSLLTKDTSGNLAMTYVAEATKQIRYAFKSGLSWSTQNLFQSSSTLGWPSLVYDRQNRPNVTVTDPVSNDVKYIGWLSIPSVANISVIDSVNNPGYYSLLTKDTSGNLAMTYVAEATKQIRYAFKSGLSWSTQNLFQSSSTLGWPSLVYDRQNQPNVTVTDPANNEVKYLGHLITPRTANISIIDASNDVGQYSSMLLWKNASPAVSYYDNTLKRLRFAMYNNAKWDTTTVDSSANVGAGTSLLQYQGKLKGVAYNDITNNRVKYAKFNSYDVGCIAILSADTVSENMAMIPRVLIRNFGVEPSTFNAVFNVGNIYSQTISVNLEGFAEETINFLPWVATDSGNYETSFRTLLVGDQDTINNVIRGRIAIIPSGNKPVIFSVSPSKGGDGGALTVDICGKNFRPGLRVRLTRDGNADIHADTSLSFVVDSSHVRAVFDLTGASLGTWNIVVVNDDNTTTTFYSGFSTEAQKKDLWATITGSNRIRFNQEQTYTIRYGNNGNNDVLGGWLEINGIPQSIAWKHDINFKRLPHGIELDSIDWSQKLTYVKVNGLIHIPILFPLLRVGQEGEINLTLRLPVGFTTPFNVVVKVADLGMHLTNDSVQYASQLKNEVASNTNKNSSASNECMYSLISLGMNVVGIVVPGNNCFEGVLNTTLQGYFYVADPSDLTPEATRNSGIEYVGSGLLAAVGCATTVFPPAEVIVDAVSILWSTFWVVNNCLLTSDIQQVDIQPVFAIDPNDKQGPSGFDTTHNFIRDNRPLLYTIRFENLKTATASAETVYVKDTLSQNLDIHSVRFDGSSHPQYLTTNIDTSTHVITWKFSGINLPPNLNPPEGEGWCRFLVNTRNDVTSGSEIKNSASIVFDYNEPIMTNTVLNTIDNIHPQSSIFALPDTINEGQFILKWGGRDDSLGSGIKSYDIFVRYDSGSYVPWVIGTTDTQAVFVGQSECIHSFYSIAKDNVGLIEPTPNIFDSRTFVKGISAPLLSDPKNVVIINNPAPVFSWSRSIGLGGVYTIQVSKDSLFINDTRTITSLVDTLYVVPNDELLEDGIYYWRVKAKSKKGNESEFSTFARFSIDTQPPDVPVLISPINGIMVPDTTLIFVWSRSPEEGVLYTYQCASDSVFSKIIYGRIVPDTSLIIPPNISLAGKTYYWRVRAMDKARNWSSYQTKPFYFTTTGIVEVIALPLTYALDQNYPNPFNPVTTLSYQLPQQSKVTLKIYNVLGQVVAKLSDEIQQAGYKQVDWNAVNVASGMYFYRITATPSNGGEPFIETRKMLLLK